ncbi:MAG: hypothetical protein ACOY5B_02670 [Spirochaetota bacterium]
MSKDHRVGFWRRAQILMHIAICDVCKGYYKFVYGIGKDVRTDARRVAMPPEMRQKLKDRLEQKRDE